jgi:Flp pilus assembly pilin Flp
MVARRREADVLLRKRGVCGTPLDHQEVTRVLQIRQLRRQEGQTMAEYGVVLAVITVMCLGALTLLSGNVTSALVRVAGLVGLGG